jgi:polysaccharide deacetylase family protein (PEP-CTERM system associated)
MMNTDKLKHVQSPVKKRKSTISPNFLTLDIEDWYHANYENLNISDYEDLDSNLEQSVVRLLDIAEENKVKTTCFVVGKLAEKHPNLVRRIHSGGHEVACHSYSHKQVYKMTPEEFEEDTRKCKKILEDITESKIYGYRAPSWSFKEESNRWTYQILEDLDFKYSSSVFPGKTFLYGIKDTPKEIHYPTIDNKQSNILEFPVTTVKLGLTDMSLHFRLFPQNYIQQKITKLNQRDIPAMLYLHPREIDLNQPKLPLPKHLSLIHYWGIKNCESKFQKVVSSKASTFMRLIDYYEGYISTNH